MSALLDKNIMELNVALAMLNAKRNADLEDFQREVVKLQKQFDWLKAHRPENRIYVSNDSTGGSVTPAGANTQLQYNDNGAFGASSDLTWNAIGIALTIGTVSNPFGFITLGDVGGAGAIVSNGDMILDGATLFFSTGGNSRLQIGAGGDFTINGSTGTAGQVLTSQGPGVPPMWVTP